MPLLSTWTGGGYVECPRLSTGGGEGVKIGSKLVHVVVECPLTKNGVAHPYPILIASGAVCFTINALLTSAGTNMQMLFKSIKMDTRVYSRAGSNTVRTVFTFDSCIYFCQEFAQGSHG